MTGYLKYELIIICSFIIFVPITLAAASSLQIPRLECYESTDRAQAYPNICNIFYECKKKQMYIKVCPPGWNFNPRLGICDLSEPNNCIVAENQQTRNEFCPPLYVGTVPYQDDCRRFIICFLGGLHYKTCENGLVYNDNKGSCDHLNNVPECSADMKRNKTLNRRNHDLIQFQTNEANDESDNTNSINDPKYEKFMYQVFRTRANQSLEVKPIVSTTSVPNVERSRSLQKIWTRHW